MARKQLGYTASQINEVCQKALAFPEKTFETASDLGTPSAGFYQIQDAGTYVFKSGVFSTLDTNGIQFTGAGPYNIIGAHEFTNGTCNTTGPLFKDSAVANTQIIFEGIFPNVPNGKFFDFTLGGGPFASLVMKQTTIWGTCAAGQPSLLTGYGFLDQSHSGFNGSSAGLICDGVANNTATLFQARNGANAASTRFMTIQGGTSDDIVALSSINTEAGSNESVFFIDNAYPGTVSIDGGVFVDNGGNLFDPAGKDQNSLGVIVKGIPDYESDRTGSLSVSDNTTATVISVQNDWYDIIVNPTTLTTETINEGWITSDTTNAIQQHKDGTGNFRVSADISAFSTGGTQDFEFRIVLNDGITDFPQSRKASRSFSSDKGSVTLNQPITAGNDWTVRVQTRNIEGTSNITIANLSFDIVPR